MPPNIFEALLYSYGCTVVINRFDRYDDALWDLCGSLATDHRCDVVGNLYVASSSSQSFGRHWDDHLVIAVQLSGTKRWSFFDAEGGPGTSLDSSAQPTYSVLLQPGDALIIPKYIWHEVVNESDELSVHVSLAFFLLTAKELFERDIARLTACSFALAQGGSRLPSDCRRKLRRLLDELSELIDTAE
ncbi:JmjC domain-containing protein [Mycobacterium sp. pW049]|uniref:JmjC domain-containing protein n=1 Tax=[Mycobacterium] bulgaricum TaxID=3238985 RepID=UPI0035A93474